MIKIFRYTLLAVFFLFCQIQCKKKEEEATFIVLKDIIDIGKTHKDKKSIAYFHVINNGRKKITPKNIIADCHCTVPNWNNKDLNPGDTLEIGLIYDNNSLGFFEQTASVYFKGIKEAPLLIMRGIIIE